MAGPPRALRSLRLLLLGPLLLAAALLVRHVAEESAAVPRPFEPRPGLRPVQPLTRRSVTRKMFSTCDCTAAVTHGGSPFPFYGDIFLTKVDEIAFFPDLEVFGHYKFSYSQSDDDCEFEDRALHCKDQNPVRRAAIHNRLLLERQLRSLTGAWVPDPSTGDEASDLADWKR
eukprot:459961-Pyramimonas_sp.AAC.1